MGPIACPQVSSDQEEEATRTDFTYLTGHSSLTGDTLKNGASISSTATCATENWWRESGEIVSTMLDLEILGCQKNLSVYWKVPVMAEKKMKILGFFIFLFNFSVVWVKVGKRGNNLGTGTNM